MGWNVKPSATTQIDRRAEPYLTEALKATLREEYLPRFETKRAAMLPALHLVQHEYGHIPFQALEEVGEFLELTSSEALDAATFYEEYWLKPKGRHMIAVCRSIACEFCAASAITKACKKRLGIELHETTQDGRFTLVELECLGACGGAPAVLVDEELHENATAESIVKRIDELRDADAKER